MPSRRTRLSLDFLPSTQQQRRCGSDIAAAGTGTDASFASQRQRCNAARSGAAAARCGAAPSSSSLYASKPMSLQHLKIAKQSLGKTVQDVELRCLWIDENRSSERKNDNQERLQKKRKDNQGVHDRLKRRIKKDASISLNASSHTRVDAAVPSHPSEPPATNDQFLSEGIFIVKNLNSNIRSMVLEGVTYGSKQEASGFENGFEVVRDLLSKNEDIFGEISVNILSNQIIRNDELFAEARANINALWNSVQKFL